MIAAVEPSLGEMDAEVIDATGHIVAPGLIDTHRHTWQTQMRALCADWTLTDYLFGIRFSVSPAYTAEDVHLGNLLGAVDALESGVTTILDFSHCNNTPEHADAALTGLLDAGIRAVFGYGFFESSPMAPPYFAEHSARLRDFERVADDLLLLPERTGDTRRRTHRGRRHPLVGHGGGGRRGPGALGDPGHPHGLRLGAAQRDPRARRGRADRSGPGARALQHPEPRRSGRSWHVAARRSPSLWRPSSTWEWAGRVRRLRAARDRPDPVLRHHLAQHRRPLRPAAPGPGLQALGRHRGDQPRWCRPRTGLHDALEALRWSTVNAADAIGLGDRIGSLTPGKQADLIIVGGPGTSQHPVLDAAGTLIFQTTTSDVRTVLVAGRVVKRDGVMVGVDLPALLGQADSSAEDILARVRAAVPVLPPVPPGGFAVIRDLASANLSA